MKIAVSINNFGMISPHLGRSNLFYIFSKVGNEVEFLETRKRKSNLETVMENDLIENIKDCDMIISGKIGNNMMEQLKNKGIKTIVEEKTFDPLEAIKKI